MLRTDKIERQAASTAPSVEHAAAAQRAPSSDEPLDLALCGGTIIDGSGAPGVQADVGVRGDRIVAIGELSGAPAKRRMDVRDRVVCPGFIDIHTHSDLTVLMNPLMESSVLQGVTTEVTGNCGLSVGLAGHGAAFQLERRFVGADASLQWDGLAGYLSLIESNGVAVNICSLAGHNTIRKRVMGTEMRSSTVAEQDEMRALLKAAMDDGAVGLSTGLEYPPGRAADTAEIIRLAEIAGEYGGIYTSHLRNESDQLIESVQEALDIGRAAHLPVQLSHHKAEGPANWGKVRTTLAMVDEAHRHGQDVTLDQYPYTAYQTGLAIPIFPSWAIGGTEAQMQEWLTGEGTRARLLNHLRSLDMDWHAVRISIARKRRDLQGKTIASLAQEWGISSEEAVLQVLLYERGFVAATYVMMSEEDVRTVMSYPYTFVASDAAASAFEGPLSHDRPHPRTFGTFPRVLGRYVRDAGVLSWETAIQKMTSMPARRLGFMDRGLVQVGMMADLVVFDPAAVLDRADDENPRSRPQGIDAVFVNGQQVVSGEQVTGARPGKALRRGGELLR